MRLFFSGSIPLIVVIIALFQKIEWRRTIKLQAREQFQQKGAWLKFALCSVIIMIGSMIVTSVLSFIPFLILLLPVAITAIVSYGSINVMRRIRRGQEFSLKDFFPTDQLGAVIGLVFVKNIYLFLWSLLFIVPGIVKAYSYSQAMFIMNDHPGIGIDEAITRSREMMNGHKWELVILQSSFIGWIILGSLTFGILMVYIIPLYAMSMFVFYEYVKNGYLKSSQYDNIYNVY